METFKDVVRAHEHELIKDLFLDCMLSQQIVIPPSVHAPYLYRLRVTPHALGLTGATFGDADALLIEVGSPSTASAVEFKRVKVPQDSFATGGLNKLGELKKAVLQANALHSAGFAHVWLIVVIVADTRSVTGGRGFGFTPQPFIQKVIDSIPVAELADGVGVVVSQIEQVSDRPANERGMAGGQLIRAAVEQKQPNEVTAAVERIFVVTT